MADKKLIDKVKELVNSNANASLKEAAQKWLDEVDAKYGDKIEVIKEKGGEAWDKLNEAAVKYSEKSIETNEKLAKMGEKFTDAAEKFADKAAPVVDELKEKAAPVVDKVADKVSEKAAPVVDKVVESEFIKQLKEGIASLDEVIDVFSKPEMKENVGEEAAEQIRKHAEAMKAEGKTFCDCPACTKAREILKELGVDLETPEAGDAEEEEPEVCDEVSE